MEINNVQLEAVSVTFTIIPTAVVGLRFYARRLTSAQLGIDDWLMIPALILCAVLAITQIVASVVGETGQQQQKGPNGEQIHDQALYNYEKCKFILQTVAVLELACTKASILFLYRRIFSVRVFRIVVDVMIGIVLAWAISFFFATVFQCSPVSAMWELFEIEYSGYCFHQLSFYVATAASDLAIDVIIFTLPLPVISRLHLSSRDRLAVAGMFLLGILVVAAGIVRVATFSQLLTFSAQEIGVFLGDMPWYSTPAFFWTFLECSVAIVSASLPTLRPIFVRRNRKQGSSALNHLSSYIRSGRKAKKFTHPLSTFTVMDEEDGDGTMSIHSDLQAGHSSPQLAKSPMHFTMNDMRIKELSGQDDSLAGQNRTETHVEAHQPDNSPPSKGIRVERGFFRDGGNYGD